MKPNYTPPVPQFLHLVQEDPNRVFLKQAHGENWIPYTRQEVLDKAKKIAGLLQSLGVKKGDKVALYSKNCAHWVISDLAIWMAGAVTVPIYPNLNQETVTTILEHSESKVVFVGNVVGWDQVRPLIIETQTCISLPEGGPQDITPLETALVSVPEIKTPYLAQNEELATIIYTSGTTGAPKGVMHNFISISSSGTEGVKWLGLNNESRFFSFLPLSHVAERVSVETQALYSGGCIYFCESQSTFAKNVMDVEPTLFFSVPRLWLKFYEKILQQIPEKKLNLYLKVPLLSHWIKRKIIKGLGLAQAQHIVTGSAATPAHLFLFFKKLGIPLQEAYGMTENFAYSHLSIGKHIQLGSVGIPYPKVQVKIGENNEIQIWSPANMVGYYKNEQATQEAFTEEGYLKTGDQGHVDENQFLYITGRVKELFKTSKGKYVRPTPIEEKFIQENLFEQVCVMGDGFPQPFAVVKLQDSISPASIQNSLTKINNQLDAHEKVSKVAIISETWSVENGFLTPTLKVKRAVVEKHYSPYFDAWMNQKEKVIIHP